MMLQTKQLDKETLKLENAFVSELEKSYKVARDNIQKELAQAFAKYSVDEKLTYAEMDKYDRLQKLLNNINGEIASLNRGMYQAHQGHAMSVYLLNAESIEKVIDEASNITVNWGILNKNAIRESILTPLDKIALESNEEAVRMNVRKAITQSLIRGDGIKLMSKALTDTLEKNANNAVRIARTETVRVMNKARLETIDRAQTKSITLMKRWVATNDDRTRDTHAALNGQTIKTDEVFDNGLMYPGDQSGDPSENINCRCALATELIFND